MSSRNQGTTLYLPASPGACTQSYAAIHGKTVTRLAQSTLKTLLQPPTPGSKCCDSIPKAASARAMLADAVLDAMQNPTAPGSRSNDQQVQYSGAGRKGLDPPGLADGLTEPPDRGAITCQRNPSLNIGTLTGRLAMLRPGPIQVHVGCGRLDRNRDLRTTGHRPFAATASGNRPVTPWQEAPGPGLEPWTNVCAEIDRNVETRRTTRAQRSRTTDGMRLCSPEGKIREGINGSGSGTELLPSS